MPALSRQELEQMLTLLDISTLESIDRKCRQDVYTYGKCPLLKYSAEALKEYATTIYRNILVHFTDLVSTEEEYVALWLKPYTSIREQLASKAENFISRLTDIVANPIPLPDYYFVIPKECLYTQITNFINNKDDFYIDLNDFLIASTSPLRRDFMHQFGVNYSTCPVNMRYSVPDSIEDPRMTAIIVEVDAMRNKLNKKLDTFIGKELKKYKSLYKERLAILNITQKDIVLLTQHKAHLSQAEWSIFEQALASEALSSKAQSIFRKFKKQIKDAHKLSYKQSELNTISKTKYLLTDEDYAIVDQLLHSTADWNLDADRIIDQYDANVKTCMASVDYQALCAKISIAQHLMAHYCNPTQPECNALGPYVTLVQHKDPDSAKQLIQSQAQIHAVTADIHKLFISIFVEEVEKQHSLLECISIFALVDAEKSLEDNEKSSYVDCNPEETERRRQAILELLAHNNYNTDWFPAYTNIAKPLLDCLYITLNDLTICPEALSHGAIVGISNWCEQVKAQLISVSEGKAHDFDYSVLAHDLRDKMQYHTLALNTADYLMVTDTALTRAEGKSDTYIQDRTASLAKPTDLLVHNMTYGIIKVCEPSPLPEVYPTDDDPKLTTVQANDLSFNITKAIRKLMIKLQPDTIFVLHEVVNLTENEVKSLKSVPDRTLRELLIILLGIRCDVYLLRGDLIAYTAEGDYYKIISKASAKDKKGKYETYYYTFTAVNWTTLNKLINDYSNLLKDTDFYDDISLKLTYRKSYVDYGINREQGLEHRYKRYREDAALLSEVKELAEKIYKDTENEALVYSMFRTYYKTYYISQHYLVKWVYNPEEYVQKLGQVLVDTNGNIINNIIHHIDKDPRNNDLDNLEIHDKDTHDDLKSNCKPVLFEGHKYPSITKYNKATKAGAYTRLQQAIDKLKPGNSIHFKDRVYTLDVDADLIIATTTQQIIYNGINYLNLTDFAKSKKLSPIALSKKLKREKEKGRETYMYKGLMFELEGNGNIKITG